MPDLPERLTVKNGDFHTLSEIRWAIVEIAMARYGGDVNEISLRLKIPTSTLYDLLRRRKVDL